jgi:hypothetical protein
MLTSFTAGADMLPALLLTGFTDMLYFMLTCFTAGAGSAERRRPGNHRDGMQWVFSDLALVAWADAHHFWRPRALRADVRRY